MEAVYYEKTKSDPINSLLSDMDMRTWGDGNQTADPAIWGEWIDSINEVIKVSDKDTLTELQAFQAMGKFLEQYIPFNTPSDAVNKLKSGVCIRNARSIVNSAFGEQWVKCVDDVLTKKKQRPINKMITCYYHSCGDGGFRWFEIGCSKKIQNHQTISNRWAA